MFRPWQPSPGTPFNTIRSARLLHILVTMIDISRKINTALKAFFLF